MAAPPRPPTTAPASGLPAAAPTSAPPPAPMAPPVSARCPGVSPQAEVASASAAQTARYVIRDMSGSLLGAPFQRRRARIVALRRWRRVHPRCARRLLWRRGHSHCRDSTSPQIRRVAPAAGVTLYASETPASPQPY